MSARDEQRVSRSVKEANNFRMPLLELHVVSNIDGGLEDIPSEITPPTPNPSPQGGGEHTECAASVCLKPNGTR